MRNNHARPLVVKYGGSALASEPDPVIAEIAALHLAGHAIVLVHGGGPEIDRALAERSIATERIGGHRVTDAAVLETVEAVLCGTINKRLVRALSTLGVPAVGVSGEDARTLVAEKMLGQHGEDLGFVGEIADCNVALVHALLNAHMLPVIAPLAVARDGSHAYNVNADLAAAAIAARLTASSFVLITNVPRVLRDPDDPQSGIDRMTADEALAFAQSEACRDSMKPKSLAAAIAVRGGAAAAYVCSAKPDAVARALAGDATTIA